MMTTALIDRADRSLKLGNIWVFVQPIHRRGTKISSTKTKTLPNLRLPMSSAD